MKQDLRQPPYSARDLTRAVNIAAMLGWACAVAPLVWPDRFALLSYAALIGLPIAFCACWLIAAPILRRIMRSPITWRHAAIWGAIVAAMIELAGVAISRAKGLWDSHNDSFNYQIGGGDQVRNIDGTLTPYGWWVQVQALVFWMCCGIVIALILRAMIGPGFASQKAFEETK